jgi:hypothetical protein
MQKPDQFWKTWKKKIRNDNKSSHLINGIGDDKLIAETFAESFAKVANEKRYSKLNDDLDFFSLYTGNVVKIDHFSVENISSYLADGERQTCKF